MYFIANLYKLDRMYSQDSKLRVSVCVACVCVCERFLSNRPVGYDRAIASDPVSCVSCREKN